MTTPVRGQALVEFVLTFLIFITVVFVIVDLGRAIWYWTAISNAAREGTNLAVINSPTTGAQPTTTLVRDRVLEMAVGVGLDVGDVTVEGCCSANSPVTVRIVYEFSPVTPIVTALTDGPIELVASSRKVGEY